VIFIILLLPLVPLLIEFRRHVLLDISLGLVALTGWSFSRAVSTPPFTGQAPQQINLIYVEEEGVPQAKLVLQTLEAQVPGSLAANLPDSEAVPPTRFAGRHAHNKPRAVDVDSSRIPPPEVELLSHEKRADGYVARFRLSPGRDSQYLMAGIPDIENLTVKRIEIAGVELPVPSRQVDGHKWLRVRGAPAEGIEIELEWSGPAELPLKIAGITGGLPSELRHLAKSRDALPACSGHTGDQSIGIKHVMLR
jgi:hypothetical protein